MSGGICHVVRAETADLDRFVDRGGRYLVALRSLFDAVAAARADTVAQMGAADVPAATVALPLGGHDPLAELIAEAMLANAFVGEISGALGTTTTDGVGRLVPTEPLDAALAMAGLDELGTDRPQTADQDLVAALAVRRELRTIVATGSGLPDHLQGHQIGVALEEYLGGFDAQTRTTVTPPASRPRPPCWSPRVCCCGRGTEVTWSTSWPSAGSSAATAAGIGG